MPDITLPAVFEILLAGQKLEDMSELKLHVKEEFTFIDKRTPDQFYRLV